MASTELPIKTASSSLNLVAATPAGQRFFSDSEVKKQRETLREDWKVLRAWAEKKGNKIDLHHM